MKMMNKTQQTKFNVVRNTVNAAGYSTMAIGWTIMVSGAGVTAEAIQSIIANPAKAETVIMACEAEQTGGTVRIVNAWK